MKREIRTDCAAVVKPIIVDNIGNVRDWMQSQANTHELRWLLAHSDDGVTWGENRSGQLVTSDSVVPDLSPLLRAMTLRQARLFASEAELLLWRDGNNKWHARIIRRPGEGETADLTEAIDEAQMLWGTHGEIHDGFTVLRDGAQGLRHAIPRVLALGEDGLVNPPRLLVRHYTSYDNNGFARITLSRLVGFVDN